MVSSSDIEVIPEDTGFNDGGTAASIGIQNNSDRTISMMFAPAPDGNLDRGITQDTIIVSPNESETAELSWSESDVAGANAVYLAAFNYLMYDDSNNEWERPTGSPWIDNYLWPDTIYNNMSCTIVDDSVDPGGTFELQIQIDNFSSVSSEIAYQMEILASEFTVVKNLQTGQQTHTIPVDVPEGIEADQISVSGYPTYVPVTPPEE